MHLLCVSVQYKGLIWFGVLDLQKCRYKCETRITLKKYEDKKGLYGFWGIYSLPSFPYRGNLVPFYTLLKWNLVPFYTFIEMKWIRWAIKLFSTCVTCTLYPPWWLEPCLESRIYHMCHMYPISPMVNWALFRIKNLSE